MANYVVTAVFGEVFVANGDTKPDAEGFSLCEGLGLAAVESRAEITFGDLLRTITGTGHTIGRDDEANIAVDLHSGSSQFQRLTIEGGRADEADDGHVRQASSGPFAIADSTITEGAFAADVLMHSHISPAPGGLPCG